MFRLGKQLKNEIGCYFETVFSWKKYKTEISKRAKKPLNKNKKTPPADMVNNTNFSAGAPSPEFEIFIPCS